MSTVPDYVLELYAQGELPPQEMEALDRRLETDDDLTARLARLRASDEEILRAYPPERFVAGLEQRRAPRRRQWFVLAPALAAAAAVLVMWLLPDSPLDLDFGIVRPKGDHGVLKIHRKVGETIEELEERAWVENHDVLQISYIPYKSTHGTVVSIDGRGAVILHFPDDATRPTELDQGETPIPHAYEIDDAPDFKRFFFVTSSSPISVSEVLRAARNLARQPQRARTDSLALPPHLDQSMFLVLKKEASL